MFSLGHLKSFDTVARHDGTETGTFERQAQDITDLRIVVDDKNCLAVH